MKEFIYSSQEWFVYVGFAFLLALFTYWENETYVMWKLWTVKSIYNLEEKDLCIMLMMEVLKY